MERRKKILAMLTITLVIATVFTPTLLINPVNATDPTDWYTNISGVLATDTYSLYPFKQDKSLTIGFSKFGEMIDSINNIGLEYRSRDAFAPAAGATVPTEIAKKKWMSGWLINVTYTGTSGTRNIWAVAQHADLIDYGKDWIRVHSNYNYSGALTEATEDPRDVGKFIGTGVGPVNGGRKTNGTAVTDAIEVLYNGPRMYIARTVTHLYDWDESWSEDESLLDIVFTFIFNKVSKEVIVLKDIKEATTKFVFGQLKVPINGTRQETINATVNGALVQFSNRGEWDIGPANSYDSYVHFYVANDSQGFPTVYDQDYHLNPTVYPATWLGISDHGDEPGTSGTYDVAQIVASDRAYVGWAAFWPSLSNWHVDAGYQDKWWKSLMQNESAVDTTIEPFMSPYLIGEWDFVLTKTQTNATGIEGYENYWRIFDRQFRGVTVYGLTDNWIGDDAKRSGGSNIIDREATYQLEEIFNPYDLYGAVHQDTRRWVDFHTVTTQEKTDATAGTNLTIVLSERPVTYASQWDTYCNSTERVEWGGAVKLPARSVNSTSAALSANEPYELYVNSTGHGNITIRAASVPVAGSIIKILYSTNCTITYTHSDIESYYGGTLAFGNVSRTVTNATSARILPNPTINSTSWTDKLDILQNISILEDIFVFTLASGSPLTTALISQQDDLNITVDVKIPPESGYITVYNSTYFAQNITTQGNQWNVTYNGNMTVQYKIDPQQSLAGRTHEYVHVTGSILLRANHTLSYNGEAYVAIANYTIAAASLRKEIMGRFEWVVVGNHSRTIDSIGASLVSAAFKNKQVEIGNGGLDMKDMWGTNVPILLANRTYTTWRPSGPAWTNIYDSIGRLHLVDDWCTRYPVTSSNIITVAGPSANLMSEYFNEYSQAIQIYGGMTGMLLSDVIFATTCWNVTRISNYLGQRYYSNGQFQPGSTNTGIGVITTYKDINGTVGFLIHGWSGDDTYYTCKWFHEYGIYYLQTENRGVTTLIIRLDYNQNEDYEVTENPMPPNYTYDNHNPQVTILERLGTISEKTPHDP